MPDCFTIQGWRAAEELYVALPISGSQDLWLGSLSLSLSLPLSLSLSLSLWFCFEQREYLFLLYVSDTKRALHYTDARQGELFQNQISWRCLPCLRHIVLILLSHLWCFVTIFHTFQELYAIHEFSALHDMGFRQGGINSKPKSPA